jgi:hypothetical protein
MTVTFSLGQPLQTPLAEPPSCVPYLSQTPSGGIRRAHRFRLIVAIFAAAQPVALICAGGSPAARLLTRAAVSLPLSSLRKNRICYNFNGVRTRTKRGRVPRQSSPPRKYGPYIRDVFGVRCVRRQFKSGSEIKAGHRISFLPEKSHVRRTFVLDLSRKPTKEDDHAH